MCMCFHFSTIHRLVLVFGVIDVFLHDLYWYLVHVFMNCVILLYYLCVHVHHK